MLKKYIRRIWHIHFKDCHPEVAASSRINEWDYFKSVANGVFCDAVCDNAKYPFQVMMGSCLSR
ncbi:MAG: hypothetical protein MUF36_12055 [Bacteroidales bacterium]|nr:hypothetical protein [Bacteroidales bacterium]